MDGSRDLNISGYKIVNVADPTEAQHVTTKHYVDQYNVTTMTYIEFLRQLTPVSTVEEYVRYINRRKTTCHRLK